MSVLQRRQAKLNLRSDDISLGQYYGSVYGGGVLGGYSKSKRSWNSDGERIRRALRDAR